MIKDAQEYLQHWEKENNPFYPSEMRWGRLEVNRFLKDYKEQLNIHIVVFSESELKAKLEEQLEETRKWLISEDFEGLAERL